MSNRPHSETPNLADWRHDVFWLGVIAFVFWVVVPNLPVIAAVIR